jgi:hypothetical protein
MSALLEGLRKEHRLIDEVAGALVVCRDFGDGCDGIEREWWTEQVWEGFHSRDF